MKQILTFVCAFLLASPLLAKKNQITNSPFDNDYHLAQLEFHKKNYSQFLAHAENYLKNFPKDKKGKNRFFWIIDQVGYVHLRVKKDPDNAIQFFLKYKDDKRLNIAQSDTVLEWLGAAQEWKKEKVTTNKTLPAEKLFRLGKKYFDAGQKKNTYPLDDKGNANFAIAETYLRPFIINYDSDKNIGNALLMMGRIKIHLKTDYDYWTENYYLKETIRRFPRTKLAQQAWGYMNDDIRMGYSGSSGEHTPYSLRVLLKEYKKLAYGK